MNPDDAALAQHFFSEAVLDFQRGNTTQAIANYMRALELAPDFPEAHSNLGVAWRQAGNLRAAELSYREALRIRPGYAEPYNNLGNLFAIDGRLDEANECFRKAIELRPDFVSAYVHLVVTLRRQGRPQEAAQVSGELFKLGNRRQDLNDIDGAIACYEQVLQLQPDHFGAQNNLGTALTNKWDLDRALSALQAAAALRPDLPEAPGNLGTVYLLRGQLDDALQCYRRALELNPEMSQAHSNLLMVLNYAPDVSPGALFAEHKAWARVHAAGVDAIDRRSAKKRGGAKRRLRVGYVSPDFHDHPVTRFFEPILARQDRKLVETFCYSLLAARDSTTQRLEATACHWREAASLEDRQIADQILEDGIDVLVDLAGHTRNNRLLVFARRPAPVQLSYLGYPATTGLGSIDYLLTDKVLDPPGEPQFYTEELVYLRTGFCPFSPPADAPDVSPLPALRSGTFTFGSVHNFAKLNARVLDLWCRLLQAVPHSRLLIYRNNLVPSVRDFLQGEFAARQIPLDRIEMLQATDSNQRFMGGYALMDVLLDATPFSGHTTTCEALWMGVPVLTLYGDRRAGRMSASVLKQVGMADWIAKTPEEYVRKAAAFAKNTKHIADVRRGLRRRMLASALCDCDGFTRNFDATLLALGRARRV